MAIVYAKDTTDRTGELDAAWQRTYTRKFEVLTDEAIDDASVVLAALATGGLNIGLPYVTATGSDPKSFIRGIKVSSSADDGKYWDAEVEYGPFDPNVVEDPLSRPPDISFGFVEWEEIVDEDISNNPVVNTAGDAYDPPVTRQNHLAVLSVSRYESTFNALLASQYKDSVNSDVFFDAPVGTAKIMDISAAREWSQFNQAYIWRVNYEFQFDPRGWTKKVLNQGYRQLVSGARRQILIDGAPATFPCLLDSAGALLAPTGTPVYRTFTVYPTLAFSTLGLGL